MFSFDKKNLKNSGGFSDGVGYNWIDQIIAHCSAQVTDREMKTASERFPHNTPETKEAYYIRNIFARFDRFEINTLPYFFIA